LTLFGIVRGSISFWWRFAFSSGRCSCIVGFSFGLRLGVGGKLGTYTSV
jgi:hypothetical protein